MDFFLAASLAVLNLNALCPGEKYGAAKRVAFYGKQAQGLVLSQLIDNGMSWDQVNAILGDPCTMSVEGRSSFCEYVHLGISVANYGGNAYEVKWHFCAYSPRMYEIVVSYYRISGQK